MSKELREYLLFISKITAIALIFTAVAYNIKFSERIYRYVTIAVFYFVCTALLKKPSSGNLLLNCLLIALPSIVIDGSVLLTAPNFVPLRFPFSSVFPLFGCFGGYLFVKRKYILTGVVATVFILFSVISFLYIIPAIIFSKEQVKAVPVKASFLNTKFLDRHGDTISLSSYKREWLFVDFFFVGCAPCDLKEKMFSELVSEKISNNYKVLIICNGSISSFDAFLKHVQSKPDNVNTMYLYDFGSNISRYFPNVTGYPYEVVFRQGEAYRQYSGFNEESFQLNKAERIRIIESSQ